MKTLLDLLNFGPQIAFGGDDSGGGGGSPSSSDDDKPAKPTLTKADNTIGQVSKTGQYAGDGFEWVETTTSGGSQFLTRTYTGAGKDNGLGQDVRFGNTAQKDEKEVIAQISLNEGSAFAGSKASATDIPANDIGIPTGFFPASDSYAEQVGRTDYKPTVKYIDSEPAATKTFAETFAQERDKQGDGGTFTYEGKEYTTNLAPIDTSKPLTSSIRPEPEVETGPAFDYTGVSMGELGRGAPEGTLPPGTAEYKGGVKPEMEVLSALKNSSSDPVGQGLMSTGEYLMAQDYENQKADSSTTGTKVASKQTMTDESPDLTFTNPRIGYESGQDALQSSPDYLTGLDGSGPNTVGGVSDAFYGGPGYQIEPAVAIDQMQDAANNKSLLNIGTTDLLPGLAAQGGEQVVSGILETARDLNLPGSGAEFVQDPMYKYRAAGLGDMSGLDRMTDEQYLYRTGDLASQETGSAAMRLPNATTVVENVLQNIADKEFAEMQQNIEKLSPETRELVQSPAVTIPNKFGYGLDQVDPAFARPLGEDPNKLNLSGIKVDPMAAGAQTILTSPAFLATLGTSFANPAAGGGLGGTLAGGEGQRTINAEIDEALESGVLQNTPQYQQYLTALNASENTSSLSQADKDARIVGQLQNDASRGLIPLNFLAAGVSALTPGLLKSGRTGAAASPLIEGAEEGPFETTLTNRALLGATDIEKKVDPSELASEALVGGLTATGPSVVSLVSPRKKVSTKTDDTTDTKAFVPTSATAGQTATSPAGIQTEYEKAAGVDTTQMRPEIAPDRVTVAEMLMDQQLVDQGAIDVTDLQDLGLTLNEMETAANRAITNRMDKDAKMLRALAEDSVVNTGGISSELVEEMNTKLNPDVVARITQEAFSNPLVTKDGETRVDLGIQKAAIEAALQKPPSGIEQAMIPPVEDSPAFNEINESLKAAIDKEKELGGTPPFTSVTDGAGITNPFAESEETSEVVDILQKARAKELAGSAQLITKKEAKTLVDAGLLAPEDALSPMFVSAKVRELLAEGPESVLSRVESPEIVVSANEGTAPGETQAITDGDMADQAIEAGVDSIQDLRKLRADNETSPTLVNDAVNLVNETGKASPSYLQRNLNIGYDRANEIVLLMQTQGLVSEPNHVGKRTVNTDAVAEAARELSLAQAPQAITDLANLSEKFDSLLTPQQSDVTEFTAIGTEDGVKSRGVFTNALEAKAKALRENVGPEAAEAYEAAVKAQFSPPTPEVTKEVSGIEQVADTKDTTPKLSPFTEEGRKGIAALNTTPSKVNLSQTEEEVAVDTKPPSPFTPEGRAQIEAQKGTSTVNLTPAENVKGKTSIPATGQTTVETDGSTTVDVDRTAPKVARSIDPPESPDDEDEAVEVEVDDVLETDIDTDTDTGTTVELDLDLPFVAPDIVKDENGNDTFQCPDDSYTLVQGPDGPTCKKNERASRMRAGRSLSPYTRLNIPEGYKGPGQKRESPRA